ARRRVVRAVPAAAVAVVVPDPLFQARTTLHDVVRVTVAPAPTSASVGLVSRRDDGKGVHDPAGVEVLDSADRVDLVPPMVGGVDGQLSGGGIRLGLDEGLRAVGLPVGNSAVGVLTEGASIETAGGFVGVTAASTCAGWPAWGDAVHAALRTMRTRAPPPAST